MAEKALYEVPHRNSTMVVKLTAEEAQALYGDDAKRVGDVKKAEPQPVGTPPYAEPVPAPGESAVADEEPEAPKPKARTAANKARAVAGDK